MNDIPLAIILPNAVERPLTDITVQNTIQWYTFNGIPMAIILPNTVQRCTVQRCTVQQCTVDDGEIIPEKCCVKMVVIVKYYWISL